MYAFLICPMRVTSPAQLIFTDLITLIIFVKYFRKYAVLVKMSAMAPREIDG
jgi:hypothetical protein